MERYIHMLLVDKGKVRGHSGPVRGTVREDVDGYECTLCT